MKAAALAKVSGTVERVETNVDSSAPYEAHIRKADGTEVEVQVSKDYTVAAVNTMGGTPSPYSAFRPPASADAVAGEARRLEDAVVAGDAQRVVAVERRRPRRAVRAHRERGGRVGVGRREVRPDDGDREQAASAGGRCAGR